MPGPLAKAHEKYKDSCNKCHTPFQQKTQSSLCLDCHDKVALDRRKGFGFHSKNPIAAKSECRHCHKEHKGRAADIVGLDRDTFDHRQTDFLLKGQHLAAPCEGCHKPKVAFRAAPGRCVDCHRSNDPHKGRLGEACQSCHTPKAWTKAQSFDHSKTKFPLAGSHAKVACDKCHAGQVYKGVPTKCSGCHSIQDVHKGARGPRCETCHSPRKWKTVRFDHNRDTKFPLNGAHQKSSCTSCHRGNVYSDKLPTTCNGCHGRQDPHRGALGAKCERCHNEQGWHAKVAFDHDLSRFPLIGLHAAVGCDSCHRTKDFKKAPRLCAACHEDSVHQNRLGTDCGRCHTPNGWNRWTFDHAREARFELTGAHRVLDCHACHRQPASGRVSAPRSCYACHSSDDAHRGAFGQMCETCHSTDTFRRPRFRR